MCSPIATTVEASEAIFWPLLVGGGDVVDDVVGGVVLVLVGGVVLVIVDSTIRRSIGG
jgi:hypothetical protein